MNNRPKDTNWIACMVVEELFLNQAMNCIVRKLIRVIKNLA